MARPAHPGVGAPAISSSRGVPLRVVTTTYMGATERTSAGPAGAGVRRRGQDPVRRPADAAARQGMAVPARTPDSTPPTSGRRTCPAPRCWTAWSGTFGSLGSRPRRCWRSSCAPSTPTGTTPASRPTTRTGTVIGSTTRWPSSAAAQPRPGHDHRCPGWRSGRTRTSSEMLEALDRRARRARRHRNLIVAATGTGKTVIAALDYARLCEPTQADDRRCCSSPTARRSSSSRCGPTARCWPTPTSASSTSAARGPSGGSTSSPPCSPCSPTASRTSRADAYDDRGHRRVPPRRGADLPSASSSTSQPRELLGLTATPERADGVDVRVVLRRPHRRRTAAVGRARARTCSCPFHYFGIADGTDLRAHQLDARRATTQGELSNLYTGNDARAAHRPQEPARQGRRPRRACGRSASASPSPTPNTWRGSSTRPASPPLSVTGDNPSATTGTEALDDLRTAGQRPLHRRSLQRGRGRARRGHRAVPAADRERHDLPAAARPRAAARPGQGRADRAGLRRPPPQGVPLRPPVPRAHRRAPAEGSSARSSRLSVPARRARQIVLDRQTQELVLENIRSQVTSRWKQIVGELRPSGESTCQSSSTSLAWTSADVIRAGPVLDAAASRRRPPDRRGRRSESELLKRVRAFAHVDDPGASAAYRGCSQTKPRTTSSRPAEQTFARMLFFSLWPDGGGFASYAAGWLRSKRASACEMTCAVIDLGLRRTLRM